MSTTLTAIATLLGIGYDKDGYFRKVGDIRVPLCSGGSVDLAIRAALDSLPPNEAGSAWWESYESEQRRRVKRTMEWSDYPIGTKAPAHGGGSWTRVKHGWKWGSLTGGGGVFPTPGGDADGTVITPNAEVSHRRKEASDV